MYRISSIMRLTFLEARRRRIVPAALVCGALFLLVYGAALFFIFATWGAAGPGNPVQRQVQLEFLVVAGLYVVNFLAIAVAVLLPVDTLSGEIDSGVMQTLASKPVHRSEIVLGKWLTYLAMTAAYVVLMGGGIALIAFTFTGFWQPHLERVLPLMILAAAIMLTVTTAGGVRLTTITNGIVAFGFYGVAFIGGWVEQIGALTKNEAARYIGTAISLVNPSDALWRRASHELLPPLVRDLQITPFASASVPSNAMIVWAGVFVVLVLGLALRWFARRPL